MAHPVVPKLNRLERLRQEVEYNAAPILASAEGLFVARITIPETEADEWQPGDIVWRPVEPLTIDVEAVAQEARKGDKLAETNASRYGADGEEKITPATDWRKWDGKPIDPKLLSTPAMLRPNNLYHYRRHMAGIVHFVIADGKEEDSDNRAIWPVADVIITGFVVAANVPGFAGARWDPAKKAGLLHPNLKAGG